MILGVSHMTLGCADLDAGAAALKALGYDLAFVERDVPNPACKLPFMAAPQTAHAMALTRASRGLPIELIWYHDVLPRTRGAFTGVFGDAPPFAPAAAHRTLLGADVIFAADGGGLGAAVVQVADLARSRKFWEGALRYQAVEHGADWVRLTFRAPVPAWRFSVVLHQQAPSAAASLDAAGMACLSHLTSALPADRASLLEHGATGTTGPFDLTVGGKAITVEILRGPDGEFVELLQVNRAN